MKKIYYSNVRYQVIVKMVLKNGNHVWLRQGPMDIKEAKRMYISFYKAIGERIHTVSEDSNIVFHGHMPDGRNGLCGGILIEEVRPIYFE